MRYVTEDMMVVVAEIATRRLRQVCSKMARITGEFHALPEEMETMKAVAAVHNRFLEGDYRMSETDWHYTRDLCNWLAFRWAELNHQPEPEPIEFREADLWTEQCRPPGTYDKMYFALASGQLDEQLQNGG